LYSYNHYFFILASSVHSPLSPTSFHWNLFEIHLLIYPSPNIASSIFLLQLVNLRIIDIRAEAFSTDSTIVIQVLKRLEE
jgi:hypothetical protein